MFRKIIGFTLVISALALPVASASTSPADVDGGISCTGKQDWQFCGGIACFYYFYEWKTTSVDTEKVVTAGSSVTACTTRSQCSNTAYFPPVDGCDPIFDK